MPFVTGGSLQHLFATLVAYIGGSLVAIKMAVIWMIVLERQYEAGSATRK